MDQKIFRKVSVERLSSPENLDQVMHVVPAKNWMALLCLFAVVAIVIAWAVFGEIARQVRGLGVLPSAQPGEVVALLSAGDGVGVEAGMEAFIVLPSHKHRAIPGQVAAVQAVDGPTLTLGGASLPLASLASRGGEAGGVAALIRIDAGEAARAQKLLAEIKPEPMGESTGWFCQVEIVVERFPPVRLILPEGTERDEASR
jgi:hypothetical protein